MALLVAGRDRVKVKDDDVWCPPSGEVGVAMRHTPWPLCVEGGWVPRLGSVLKPCTQPLSSWCGWPEAR